MRRVRRPPPGRQTSRQVRRGQTGAGGQGRQAGRLAGWQAGFAAGFAGWQVGEAGGLDSRAGRPVRSAGWIRGLAAGEVGEAGGVGEAGAPAVWPGVAGRPDSGNGRKTTPRSDFSVRKRAISEKNYIFAPRIQRATSAGGDRGDNGSATVGMVGMVGTSRQRSAIVAGGSSRPPHGAAVNIGKL